MNMMKDAHGIDLVFVTIPFLYSNFLAFFAPLPNDGKTQWELTASFGHGSTKIDMVDGNHLGRLVGMSLF